MLATLYERYPVGARLTVVACISLGVFACDGGAGVVPENLGQVERTPVKISTTGVPATKVASSGAAPIGN